MNEKEQLLADWLEAKQEERKATKTRVEIEEQILALIPAPDEGSKTESVGDMKVTLTQRINRKVDDKAWSIIREEIPEEIRPIEIIESLKIDNRGLKWLEENEPGYYKLVCKCITEKPAKVGVKVEVKP